MIKATLCIDDAVGEYRRVLLDAAERPFRLDIERWSERGRRAKLDEIWWGRAVSSLAGRQGWLVDIGAGPQGILETKAAITEGAMIAVRVKSEAWADKGPVLSLADMSPKAPKPEKAERHTGPDEDPFLSGVELIETISGAATRPVIDHAIEEALSRRVDLPGGGQIAIDPTDALTAIDIDSAGGASSARPAGHDHDIALNIAVAGEAARQVSLRGIGGLVVVDFVTMKNRTEAQSVTDAFRLGLEQCLGRASKVLDISALGLCEAAIARRARPLASSLAAADESEALLALRRLEDEGRAGPHRIEAALSRAAAAWLEADTISWTAALADRIGARWTIRGEDRAAGQLPKVGPKAERAS